MNANLSDPDVEAINRAISILAEHWECIQVLASRYDGASGETVRAEIGVGNWLARKAHAQEFVDKIAIHDEEHYRTQAVAAESEDDDDES